AALKMVRPDAGLLAILGFSRGSYFLDTLTLPATGTYTIAIDPSSTYTGSTTITLYDVPPDTPGTIVPGGSAVTVSFGTPGQNGRLTFSGTAGQHVSLLSSGSTIYNAALKVLKPDASAVGIPFGFSMGNYFLD